LLYKRSYAASASVLALGGDGGRVPVYILSRPEEIYQHLQLKAVLVISALIGVRAGKKWLESLKSAGVNKMVRSGIIASGVFISTWHFIDVESPLDIPQSNT
jgi:hypothetical protein